MLIVLIVAANYLFVSLAVGGLCLWLIARLLRVEGFSYLRALLTVFYLTMLSIAALAGAALFQRLQSVDENSLPAMLCFVIGLILSYAVAHLQLRTSHGKTVIALVAYLIVGTILGMCLATALRYAILETFTSPTGGMASAILGRHHRLICDNCGCNWFVAARPEDAIQREPRKVDELPCPNCGQSQWVNSFHVERRDKFVIQKRLATVARWDVVAHRYRQPFTPAGQPEAITYLQRVVGMPGETVEIAAGDLFINGQRLAKAPHEAPRLWSVLHDTRFVPQTPVADAPGWQPVEDGSGWEPNGGAWTCHSLRGGSAEMAFHGELRDLAAYNELSRRLDFSNRLPAPALCDVSVECTIDKFTGAGSLGCRWEFDGRTVNATVTPSGQVTLSLVSADGTETDDPPAPAQTVAMTTRRDAKRNLRWMLMIRDGRAYAIVDRAVLAELAVLPSDIERARRENSAPVEPCRVTLIANEVDVTLSRIVVAREAYYRDGREMEASPRDIKDRIVLRPDEYLVLGDNSARSKDGRFIGPIRKADIVGPVLGIYWPPDRWADFTWAN